MIFNRTEHIAAMECMYTAFYVVPRHIFLPCTMELVGKYIDTVKEYSLVSRAEIIMFCHDHRCLEITVACMIDKFIKSRHDMTRNEHVAVYEAFKTIECLLVEMKCGTAMLAYQD